MSGVLQKKKTNTVLFKLPKDSDDDDSFFTDKRSINSNSSSSSSSEEHTRFNNYKNIFKRQVGKRKMERSNMNIQNNSSNNLAKQQSIYVSSVPNLGPNLNIKKQATSIEKLRMKPFYKNTETSASKSKSKKKESSKRVQQFNFPIPKFIKEVKIDRKKRKKMLYKCTDDNEEDAFIKNQENCLIFLKKLAESIKGYKISENCFQPDGTTNGDRSSITHTITGS